MTFQSRTLIWMLKIITNLVTYIRNIHFVCCTKRANTLANRLTKKLTYITLSSILITLQGISKEEKINNVQIH